jgi:hypothetical protein
MRDEDRPRRPAAAALFTVCLSLVWIVPHLLHLRQVPDRGDPIFSAWRLARFAHQLATDPAHLFDGNIFYPRPWTLAYSDATVLQGLIAAPFIRAGVDPLLVSNTLFLAAFPLCALAFFYSSWRLTRNEIAATIAGLLGAWYPFHADHYSHLELQWFMFCPLAFVLTLETTARPTRRSASRLGAVVALQCLASMYVGLMLITVLVPVAVLSLVRLPRPSIQPLLSAMATIAMVILPVALFLWVPYSRARASHGERAMTEIGEGSAAPGDYLKTTHRLATYRWHSRAANRPERALFPGVTPVLFGAVGLLAIPSGGTLPLAAGAVTAFDLSLGLHGPGYG